ncbi:tetratricopeptide repeat protein [Acinetobacter larvae]|uniref:Sel1 repeat family protein n=1 Tax=Acinetobacter larvae TaxID=1789224 RepID=A0A1B2LXN1_9GAMM|nr:tetratricopeptide repeat protein [Acinetobacter larvae]AOA57513.1 hypothetical protein BFG52_03520 [Acinetobacter larvae]
MKKLLLVSSLLLASHTLYAAEAPQSSAAPAAAEQVKPEFVKVQQLVEAEKFPEAYKELERLSKAGNTQATYNLAFLTQAGQGTKADNKKAIQLFEKSSNGGFAMASYSLAQIYAGGELGVKADPNKAKQYLEKASTQGLDDATIDLAVMLFSEDKPQSDQQALQKLNPLIQKGHPQAQYVKALYDLGQGIKNKNQQTTQTGLASIQDLAKKGYIPAMFAAANIFVKGEIVEQNLDEAKKIFEVLANDNVPNAKESLDMVNKLIAEKKPAAAKK